ncbi:dihydrodipicolinate synthase family protein [Hymenobacter terrenus]|uniref:dihydrodipicolinate synthase family protein n=1 Tax=Hymenobacter terrenus TaxID=1629124 RepID=UPI000619BAC8|nr:dihydrodipicolinate synthase family protein [Hymenobacter terrenus]
MLSSAPFKGIIAYPITPFTAAGAVDLDLYARLVERLVAGGAHGIAPLGSTGVLPYLTDAERDAVTTATIGQVAGRLPVLVGVSHLTTAGAVRHARFAEQAGATAVMLLPMSYWKLTESEILRHYETVATAVSVPIMVYNNPATGGLDMSPALLQRLLQLPNVTMVKESTGDVQRMQALRRLLGEDVAFYNGSNPLALAAFAAGATGWCTAAPNLIPKLNLALYEAIQANRLDQAQQLFYQQFELLQFIVAKGLPRAIKAGLELQGLDAGHLRAPLLPLTNTEVAELRALLQAADALAA